MGTSKKQNRNGERKASAAKVGLEDDVDALFTLPLAEFTDARNTLAARLKKSGRGEEAALVKALAKPSLSAWTVNQLYWNHREPFDRLIASGQRFHKAQASSHAAKVADMREALDARREALTHLSDLATSLLRDAGNSPSLETVRRITTTLEAISAMSVSASRSDAPRPGRLTHDVDPPGFESFGSFVPAAGATKKPPRLTLAPKSSSAPTNIGRKVAKGGDVRGVEETRKAKIAEAKVSLQDAKKSLAQARARAQRLEDAQKKADAEEKKAEKHKRVTEESFEKAKAALEEATGRARKIAVEAAGASKAVGDAEDAVEEASKELEALSR